MSNRIMRHAWSYSYKSRNCRLSTYTRPTARQSIVELKMQINLLSPPLYLTNNTYFITDKYDRDIAEAIKDSNKRKTSEERMQKDKPSQQRMTNTSDGSNNSATSSSDSESSETDTEKHNPEENDGADGSEDEEYVENEEDDIEKDEDEDEDEDEEKVPSLKQNMPLVHRPKGSRFSSRLARVSGHTIPESMNLGTKNRSRQRPSVNTAVESIVVADSEDESLS